jgi:hypothetical protein
MHNAVFVPDSVEVLTAAGWSSISQLPSHEKVLQLTEDGDAAVYGPIDCLVMKHFKGDMHVIHGKNAHVMTTAAVQSQRKMMYFKQNSNNDYLSKTPITSPVILGAWLGRAYIDVLTRSVVFILENDWCRDVLLRDLERFECSYELKMTSEVYVQDDRLYDYFSLLKSDPDFPEFIWKWHAMDAKTCVDMFMDGKTTRHMTIYRAEQLQRLVAHSGHALDIHYIDSNKCMVELLTEEIDWEPHCTRSTIKDYVGNVYCVEVPGGMVYTRFHGKVAWL